MNILLFKKAALLASYGLFLAYALVIVSNIARIVEIEFEREFEY